MPSSDPFSPGVVIAQKYRVERVIGEGAMGRVVAATHLDLEQPFALKFMTARSGANAELVTRFLREAKAAGRLKSEHVIRVFDVGRLEDDMPYLVMELLEGEDASATLVRRGPLPPFEAAELIAQAAEGVADAHREGIVHRDIKPQNLFLCANRGRLFVKVLDFGISKITPPPGGTRTEATLTKVPLGTPLYMAPEQLRSSSTVDARADVWALGATLYELLTGDPPFMAPSLGEIYLMISQDPPMSPRARRPSVPFGLEAIVMRCLEKKPDARYPDAGALQRALVGFLSSQSLTDVARPDPRLMANVRLGTDPGVSGEAATFVGTVPEAFRAFSASGSPLTASSVAPATEQRAPRAGIDGSPPTWTNHETGHDPNAANATTQDRSRQQSLAASAGVSAPRVSDAADGTLSASTSNANAAAPRGSRGLVIAAGAVVSVAAAAAVAFALWKPTSDAGTNAKGSPSSARASTETSPQGASTVRVTPADSASSDAHGSTPVTGLPSAAASADVSLHADIAKSAGAASSIAPSVPSVPPIPPTTPPTQVAPVPVAPTYKPPPLPPPPVVQTPQTPTPPVIPRNF